jgi:hypothetical protein
MLSYVLHWHFRTLVHRICAFPSWPSSGDHTWTCRLDPWPWPLRGSVVAWAAFEREKFRAQVIRRPGASHCNCQRATGGQFGCRRGYGSFNQATGQIGAGTGETAEGHGGDLFPQVRRVRTLAAPSPLKCPLVARQCGHHHCAGYFGA